MTEAEEIWTKLKYGKLNKVSITFEGDGHATKFNTSWVSDARFIRVTINDVAKSEYRDFSIKNNDVVFKEAPGDKSTVLVEAYE